MATKNLALRNKMSDDFGALFNLGKLIIRDGTTVLVTFDLLNPAFGAAVTGTISVLGTPITSAAVATGTAGNAILENTDGTRQIIDLTVGTVATNVIINSTAITSGQNIDLISFEWTETDIVN